MRTTIRLNDVLFRELKQYAAKTGQSMTAVIEGALHRTFRQARTKKPKTQTHLTTVKGKGLLPGVDLDDTSSLLDLMDSSHVSH